MTSPAPAVTASWPAAAGQRVALPYGARDTQFAQHVTRRLLDQRNKDVYEIVGTSGSASRIKKWTDLFRRANDAELFEFFTYRPLDVVEVFAERLDGKRRWSTLVEIYEAWYTLAAGGRDGTALTGGVPFAVQVGAAHLARTRWALLSLPFTPAGRPSDRDLQRVDDDTGRLVALVQQARGDWLVVLGEIDDYPQLAGRIGDVEAEARDIATVPVTRKHLGLDPLDGVSAAEDHADLPGREATRFAVIRLLLPRFAWGSVTRAVLRSLNPASLGFSTAALAAALTAVLFFGLASIPRWSWAYTVAAIAAAAVYLFITAATTADARAAWPWLLRQPASAAVGLLALAAFGPDWWYTHGANGATVQAVIAAGGLTCAGMAYLYVEAVQHGIRGIRLLWRPPLVGFLGLIHGLLVSLIGLRFLLPVFAASPTAGPPLSCWYAIHSCSGQALPAPLLMALAAAWSFAAGVFLQIVWDDQPVTAPLTHVSWRRGG